MRDDSTAHAPLVVHCETCGVALRRCPSQVHQYHHHYCSQACKNANKGFDLTCDYCGTRFRRGRTRVLRSHSHYCSCACRVAGEKRSVIVNDDGTAIVPLGHGFEAIIDSDMASVVGQYNWIRGNNGYAAGHVNGTKVLLHRLIMGFPSAQVDHINLNPLDNRRANLRIATSSQNVASGGFRSTNSSGFRGVYPMQSGRWAARIKVHYQQKSLGTFPCREDAARAYDRAAVEAFGEFARLNFPGDGQQAAHDRAQQAMRAGAEE